MLPAGEVLFVRQSWQSEEPVAALYLPAKHGVHVPPSGPLDPALQVHEALPANELENAEQFVQDEEPVPGVYTMSENLPAPQSTHATDPGFGLNLPATQPIQLSCVPDQPALHEQFRMLMLLMSEYAPSGHHEHATDPGLSLYLPAIQPIQSLLLPDQPALHEQLLMLSLPMSECESRGQKKHCDLSSEECEPDGHGRHLSVDAFTKTEKWPAPQSMHAMDPGLSLYLPATQPTQSL